MGPLGATQLSERIREFLHVLHAYRIQPEIEEVIRVVEKPGWANETELSQLIGTVDALYARLGEMRFLTKRLIEDARAITRRHYSAGDAGSNDSQGADEPRLDQE